MARKKPRLPLHQIFFFSVGHVMNDLVAAIFYSYLLTYQTKVLALPSSLVGFLWLIPQAVDAFLAVMIGYISDNCSIPFFSTYYGKRKTLHLIGCTMVGIFTPFLLMPCFICDKGDYESWLVVAYYVVLLIFAYSGWGLTQANFLTLIPEIATRQSEMVKLGAISSAVTLIGGIYVYVVTWVLLGNDGAESLSYEQRNEFMVLGIITVGTGAVFTILFHLGIHEPSAKGCRSRKPVERKSSRKHSEKDAQKRKKPLPATTEKSDGDVNVKGVNAQVNPSFEEDKEARTEHIALDTAALKQMLRETLPEENMQGRNDDDDSDLSYSSFDADSIGSYDGDTSGMESTTTETTDSESVELFMPQTFMDMVPFHANIVLRSRRCSTASGMLGSRRSSMIPQSRTQSRTPSKIYHHSRRTSEYVVNHKIDSRRCSEFESESPVQQHRFPSRSASKKFQQSPIEENECPQPNEMLESIQSSGMAKGSPVLHRIPPRTASVKFHPSLATSETIDENVPQGILCSRQNSKIIRGSPQLNRGLNRDGSKNYKTSPLAMEAAYNVHDHDDYTNKHAVRFSITPCQMLHRDSVAIENLKSADKKSKSWMLLFKNPVFYKLGFAYTFTRVAQNLTNSYMPLYLTDHLQFSAKAIAYFPLVVLISGVFASILGKKLNKLLGNKWTFVLAAVMVMGSSGWFYLLTKETRQVTYIPAILSGTGTSLMYVTSLALAAEFVDADRSSGAFVMAAMSFISKIVTGTLFFLLQEYTPQATAGVECLECREYVRYVFSFTPGASALLGLVAFILFIPATIRCSPIAQMEDAETQTDTWDYTAEPLTTNSLEVITEDETDESELTSYVQEESSDEEKQTVETVEPTDESVNIAL